MSSWTRRFLTHLNRVLVFRKLLLWAWNFLWGFIFWGCHFIIETVFVVAGNFTFFAFPWRILSETSAIGSKVKLLSVYKGGNGGWGGGDWTIDRKQSFPEYILMNKYFVPTLSVLFLAFHLPFDIHYDLRCYWGEFPSTDRFQSDLWQLFKVCNTHVLLWMTIVIHYVNQTHYDSFAQTSKSVRTILSRRPF